jgi:hypothetical protein
MIASVAQTRLSFPRSSAWQARALQVTKIDSINPCCSCPLRMQMHARVKDQNTDLKFATLTANEYKHIPRNFWEVPPGSAISWIIVGSCLHGVSLHVCTQECCNWLFFDPSCFASIVRIDSTINQLSNSTVHAAVLFHGMRNDMRSCRSKFSF